MNLRGKMSSACLVGAWMSVTAVLVGFFLPWVAIDVRELSSRPSEASAQELPVEAVIGQLTKQVGRVVVTVEHNGRTMRADLSKLADLPRQITGAEIPRVANREDVVLMLTLSELFTNEGHLAEKSWLVYAVPGMALLCGIVLVLGRRAPNVWVGVGIVALAIGLIGWWKLTTVTMPVMAAAITIGRGLWMSIWGYVACGLFTLLLAAARPASAASSALPSA